MSLGLKLTNLGEQNDMLDARVSKIVSSKKEKNIFAILLTVSKK